MSAQKQTGNTPPEPPEPPEPPVSPEPIIGIDLGTTNSLAAYCDKAGPRILSDPAPPDAPDDPQQSREILPSVVRLSTTDGSIEAIGYEARAHAVEHPQNTIFSVKRLMGRGLEDIQDELDFLPYEVVQGDHATARVQVGAQQISPQQISAMILAKLRHRAEAALGRPVRKAVITVPAYFDDAQRQATRDAGRIAGLEVVRIVNEPTAAALAYNIGLDKQDPAKQSNQIVAVYDLGGGTFDISILRMGKTDQGTVDQVLATAGDTHLGGDDVDRMIVELIQDEIRQQFGQAIQFPPASRQAFRNFAEATKIRLSEESTATIEVQLDTDRIYKRTISRNEFEKMIASFVQKTIDCCEHALKQAKLSTAEIARVVLVGGSTRIPLVRQKLAEFFNCDPYTALDPDKVVALGAAVQASILAGVNRDMLLLDVLPLSLGIETMGGAVAKLITANSTIPARATEMFSTYADGQTNIKIHVLQGERELVADCRSLGQFELQGIPPMPAGLPKIDVTFLVDANGILSVEAVERRSEKRAAVQIVPNHGLTRGEVVRMEAASLEHAVEDMAAHRLIDLRNQARLDIRAIVRQLTKVGAEIDEEYRKQIDAKIACVKEFLEASSPELDAFFAALDAMDKSTVRLAEIAITKILREEQDV